MKKLACLIITLLVIQTTYPVLSRVRKSLCSLLGASVTTAIGIYRTGRPQKQPAKTNTNKFKLVDGTKVLLRGEDIIIERPKFPFDSPR